MQMLLMSGSWLIDTVIGGFVLLTVGAGVAALARQPLYRLRIMQWTLLGCLLVPGAALVPGRPRVSLAILPAPSSESAPAVAPDFPPPQAANTLLEPEPLDAVAVESPAVLPVGESVDERRELAIPTAATASWQERLIAWGILGYLIVVAGLVIRILVGQGRLVALARKSRPVEPEVRALFDQLAGHRGRRVRVIRCAGIDAPLTWGVWRPVIALPEGVPATDPDRLRAWLAHEWAHVVRHDVLTHLLAAVVGAVYFYQPALYWLRRQLELCQDYLADAWAAQHAEAPESYADYLLELAHARLVRRPAGGLGIADQPSRLRRRIERLLNGRGLVLNCPWRWDLAMCAGAVLLLGGVSTLRLSAAPPEAAPSAAESAEPPVAEGEADRPQVSRENPDGSIDYFGRVIDALTDQPIAGASVEIERLVSSEKEYDQWPLLETTEHVTNERGEYTFHVPADQAQEPLLYLSLATRHAEYERYTDGFGHAMIRKNLLLGDKPGFVRLKMHPAKPVTGRVLLPDGRPAVGVVVKGLSVHPNFKYLDPVTWERVTTDQAGRFRLMVATPGSGAFWILPADYVPQSHAVPEERGEVGDYVLREGSHISGRVLNEGGEPVSGAWVNAERLAEPNAEVKEVAYIRNLGSEFQRAAQTNSKGEFRLGPLPTGEYRGRISHKAGGGRGLSSPFLALIIYATASRRLASPLPRACLPSRCLFSLCPLCSFMPPAWTALVSRVPGMRT